MKSRRFLGFALGLAVGVVEIGLGFILKSIPGWIAASVGYLNIPAALLTVGYYRMFQPTETFLKGVFYCFVIGQWATVGFLIGWFLDSRSLRQGSKDNANHALADHPTSGQEMNESQQLSEDASDSVFISLVLITLLVLLYPFLLILLGDTYGNLAGVLGLGWAARYCNSLRRRAEERSPVSALSVQDYVVYLEKRFVWVRIGLIALVALLLRRPAGLIYFLVAAGLSVAELMWESAKLGDMKDKAARQHLEPTTASGRDSLWKPPSQC